MTEVQALIVQAINNALGQKIIIRNCGGNFIVAKSPTINENYIASKSQEKSRNKFSAAAVYARKVLADPKFCEIYRKKATQTNSAFNIAVRDYLRPPTIQKIDSGDYTGKSGSRIWIKAFDDFEIEKVEVKIFNAQGNLVEKGLAKIDPILRLKWVYTSKKENAKLPGCKIRAIARDHAGNKGELEITL